MDIPINAGVQCVDGACGHSVFVILNPETQVVTHIVVKTSLFEIERLVPIDCICETTSSSIRLSCTRNNLKQMPPFVRNEYIRPDEPLSSFNGGAVLVVPNAILERRSVLVEREQIPEGEIAVRRGANVEAVDGHVGQVSEFLVNSSAGSITHLVLDEGHFWNRKHITVPVLEIDHMNKDAVYLNVTKEVVESSDPTGK